MSTTANNTETPTAVDTDVAARPGLLSTSMNAVSQYIIDLWQQWYAFWFKPEDPLMLGVIRILTGWMLVYNLLVWGTDLHTFFGSHGVQPLDAILEFHKEDSVFSFLYYVPDQWLTTVHWTCVGVAFAFFLGIGTRVTSIAAYLISISYSQRVPVANFGLDQILGLLTLYLAIGPSGACLSIDSWIRRRRAKASGTTYITPRLPSARIALRMIQLHLCVIYFWAGFAKLKGDTWWTGEAMWQVMANMEYQTFDLTWMAWLPWLPYLVAHVTVAWEVFFCVLIWNRKLRPIMLAIGTGMHFGIGAFLGMWTFGLIMTYAYFSFSDPAAWRRRIAKLFRSPVAIDEIAADNSQPQPSGWKAMQRMPQEPQKTPKASNITVSTPGQILTDADAAADEWLPNEDAALLLVSAYSDERRTLRNHFRKHDIPCRATTTPESALSLVISLTPAAIVVSGTRMSTRLIADLLDDLNDVSEAPIIALLSASQYEILQNTVLPARIMIYPASPRQIREEISRMMFGEPPGEYIQPTNPRITSRSHDSRAQ